MGRGCRRSELSNVVFSLILPREEALPQRAERHEADTELLARREHVRFVAPPEQVFALHRCDLVENECINWHPTAKAPPYRWEFTENGRDFSVDVGARVLTNDPALNVEAQSPRVRGGPGTETTLGLRRRDANGQSNADRHSLVWG